MAEVRTDPVIGVDENGDDVVCFNDSHFLADVVRWIMQNRSEAEEVFSMLGLELEKPALLH